jgi:hypothetical protein
MRIMRAALVAVGLTVASAGGAGAHPCPAVAPAPGSAASDTSIVVAPFFERVVEDLLRSSATLRDQYDRIASASDVCVRVEPWVGHPRDWVARATITRSTTGMIEAWVEIPTPLTAPEYARRLAHEFEHILEQIEGVNLRTLADDPARGVSRLSDGAYESERAQRAGHAAALEVERARAGR